MHLRLRIFAAPPCGSGAIDRAFLPSGLRPTNPLLRGLASEPNISYGTLQNLSCDDANAPCEVGWGANASLQSPPFSNWSIDAARATTLTTTASSNTWLAANVGQVTSPWWQIVLLRRWRRSMSATAKHQEIENAHNHSTAFHCLLSKSAGLPHALANDLP